MIMRIFIHQAVLYGMLRYVNGAVCYGTAWYGALLVLKTAFKALQVETV